MSVLIKKPVVGCRALCLGLLLSVGGTTVAETTAEQNLCISIDSPVIARQAQGVVTASDFSAYLRRIPEGDRAGFLYSRDRIDKALENLLRPRLIAAHGDQQGFLDDPNLQGQLYQSSVVLIAEEFMLPLSGRTGSG